mgnify:CR=1 FL=1|jgi:hypothetical protein
MFREWFVRKQWESRFALFSSCKGEGEEETNNQILAGGEKEDGKEEDSE